MNYNKAIIVGNITRDINKRELPSGQPVIDFSVATNRYWTDDKGKQEEVEFHNIVAFGKDAEVIYKYCKSKDLILIEGRIKTRSWVDKENQKHWKTEIIVENFQLAPKK